MQGSSVWFAGNMPAMPATTEPKQYTALPPGVVSVCGGPGLAFAVDSSGCLHHWGEAMVPKAPPLATPTLFKDLPDTIKFQRVFGHREKRVFLGLDADGGLWCLCSAGDNFLGGVGSELAVRSPRRIEGFDAPVVDACIGLHHVVAITRSGRVYTWGTGPGLGLSAQEAGQMANKTADDLLMNLYKPTPFMLHDLPPMVAVGAGDTFATALTADGTLYLWGQLTDQTKVEVVPKPVPDIKDVVQMVTGTHYVLCLTRDGTVLAWGASKTGGLGIGKDRSASPAPVSVLKDTTARLWCSGGSCFAVSSTGEMHGWGANAWGELGVGHARQCLSPTPVKLGDGSLHVIGLSMGTSYTLFQVAPKGTPLPELVLATGSPDQAYPELPPAFYAEHVPLGEVWVTGSIMGTGNEIDPDAMSLYTPMNNLKNKQVVDAAAGLKFAYVVTSDGGLWAWGSGHLGNGEPDRVLSKPARLYDLDQVKVVSVSTTPKGASFALTDEGRLYSWGRSGKKQLTGHGTPSDIAYPRLLDFHAPVTKIAVAKRHCITLHHDGTIYTWGHGKGLGNGGRADYERTPKRMQGIDSSHDVGDVAAGIHYSMLLTRPGAVMSWGEGEYGRLGHGDEEDKLVPTPIQKLSGVKVVQIACAPTASYCLDESGCVYAWGKGELGLDMSPLTFLDPPPVCVPTPLYHMPHIAYITTSANGVFCIAKEGQLFSWGQPHLGLGTGRRVPSPANVSSLQHVRVMGVAPGDWEALVWVAHHAAPLPVPHALRPNTYKPPVKAPSVASSSSSSSSSPSSSAPSPAIGLVAVDQDKLIEHEEYLRKLPSAHKFANRDPELDIAAACGRVSEVTSKLNKGVSPLRSHLGIIGLVEARLPSDEELIKSWVLFNINRKDFEKPRIFMVSDKAFYRVKVDFKKETVSHLKRFPLTIIHEVQVGKFKDQHHTLSSGLRESQYAKQVGLQIWTEDPNTWRPPSYSIPFRNIKMPCSTYRAYLAKDASTDEQELVLWEVCLALQTAIHREINKRHEIEFIQDYIADFKKRYATRPPFPCKKVPHVNRYVANGLVSFAHNKIMSIASPVDKVE
eukprot:TRINITY_DN3681_c0_g1_i1.p1 TRINITY_DN3681_c0_g1~~TRINITY_DN3681_c0_g1_i1.p1  ORF type:complete len:1077 (-),score=209.96 TRINITY_DN3681_c0_g1_i1:1348-4578(-)